MHALHLDRNAITLVLPDWIAAADRDADRDVDDDVDGADLDDDEREEADEAPTSLVRLGFAQPLSSRSGHARAHKYEV